MLLTSASSDKYYDRRYPELYRGHSVGLLKKPHWLSYEVDLTELLSLSGKEEVLDVGCGLGIISWEMAKHSKEVVGVDSSDSAIKMAKKRFRQENLFFIRANIMRINFNSRFDVILCLDVVEHLDFKRLTYIFNKFHEMLRWRGQLLIKFPIQGGFGNLIHALKGYKTVDYSGDWTHKWRVKNAGVIIKKLEDQGFTVAKVMKIPFFTRWLTPLKLGFVVKRCSKELQNYFGRTIYVFCRKA